MGWLTSFTPSPSPKVPLEAASFNKEAFFRNEFNKLGYQGVKILNVKYKKKFMKDLNYKILLISFREIHKNMIYV